MLSQIQRFAEQHLSVRNPLGPSMPEAVFDPVADSRQRLGVSALEAQLLFGFTSAVLFVVLIANQTHIETDDAAKLARLPELAVRLIGTALAGLLGLYGVLFIGRVQASLFRFPAIWVLGIAICYVMATVASAEKGTAVSHLIAFTSVLLFTPTALAILGTRRFFEIALGSFLLTMVFSWLLYFLLPEYGMKLEGIDDAGGTMQRMSGTSHPNTLAGIAGFAMLIVCGFLYSKSIRWKVAIPLILFCLATLFMCRTRVAPIAVVISLAVVFRGFWLRRDIFPYAMVMVGIGLLMSLAVLINSSEMLQAFAERFARSGEMEELTSVTGRNKIWAFVIEKIQASPLVGYWPGAAKNILAKEELLLHPHNVVLAVSIAGGALAGGFAIMMFLQQIWMSLRRAIPLIGLVSVFIFLNSLTETFIFGYFPGSSTIMWLAALYWFDLDDGSLAPADAMPSGSL